MRLITLILLFTASSVAAQCDVELTYVDWGTGDIQIVVHNSNGCGNGIDTTYIDHIDLGVSNGVDTLATNEFASFPLHSFLDFQEQHFNGNLGNYGYSGDTLNFNMADALNANVNDTSNPLTTLERWNDWYQNGTFCEGAEIFIWQINYSNGPQALNPDWYNPIGTSQDYPDDNPWDNILPIDGPCIVPCDTIVEIIYETDTIEIIEYIYETDTIVLIEVDTLIEYVQLPPDTVHEYIYITDTIDIMVYSTDTIYTEIEVVITEYIFETDTVTEFLTITSYIDCVTGLPCPQGYNPCDETSIYAPNAVTPNGDGWNDTWVVIADGACWGQWETRIYNRWGGLVWISTSSLDEWEADVATGVYVYTITAHSTTSADVLTFNGTITVLY
jgi:gliding motility-associated-like protein